MEFLRYEEVPFGHWGIINTENFKRELIKEYGQDNPDGAEALNNFSLEEIIKRMEEEACPALERVLRKIPKKRWDLTLSKNIRLEVNGNKILLNDKYDGRFALISAVRGLRPVEYSEKKEEPKPEQDIFARIITGEDYAITIAKDEKEAEHPFSKSPKKEELTKYKAVTIINRFPAYARIIDQTLEGYINMKIGGKHTKISKGINLVTIPIAYYERIEEASPEELGAMLSSMKTAISYVRSAAEAVGIRYIPTYPFFNIGKNVGGSLKRLHAQAYIDLNQDGHGSTMEDILKAFEEQQKEGRCKFCIPSEWQKREFLIYENEFCSAYATRAPIRNFDTKIIPKRHVEDITMLSREELNSIGEALIRISKALNKIGAHPDRNILIYQRPFNYESFFHMFIQVLPFENVGGMEMMDEARVVRVDPADFAEKMREII
ncbi:MAG: hypothetical protein QXT20_02995 [Candidatus Woesearchaeota archaeon]